MLFDDDCQIEGTFNDLVISRRVTVLTKTALDPLALSALASSFSGAVETRVTNADGVVAAP